MAIARQFLSLGARVAITGRTQESVAGAVEALGPGPTCWGIASDLTLSDAPETMVKLVEDHFGPIQILVNNAGVVGETDVWSMDAREWDTTFCVNLRAAFFASRAVASKLRDSDDGGSILNIASVAGQTGGIASGPAYAASKAGMIGLTRSLARQFASFGVRVNCIAPADVDTTMTADWPDNLRQRLIGMTPMARFGHPNEIATAAAFLVSDAASYITGQTLSVNGGILMS